MGPDRDEELVERLGRRDGRALREIIDRYGPAVYGMARRVVVDPGLAEEVAQDAFVALWRRPEAYDPGRGGLQSWLTGVARNKAVDLVRRESAVRRTREALTAEAEREPSEVAPSFEHRVDDRQAMAEALARLSPVQREAIVLAYFGGRTYREVAAELGIPEGTAKTRLRDGLARLRELLESAHGV